MPRVQVAMAEPAQMADVLTGSKAELDPPAGASPPFSWMKNGAAWTPPATPVLVDPTIGKDDIYKAADSTGATFSAVVRWKPDAPAGAKLMPGRANASVTWSAVGDERYIDYYEVDLEPRPSGAQLPRKVMRAARARGIKRVLSLDSLPPGFYMAQVRAVRESDHGPVNSDKVTTSRDEVMSARVYPATLVAAAVITVAGLLFVVPLALGLKFSSHRAVGSYANQLSAVAKAAGHVLILMLALGIVTMAVLETVKRLLPVRGYFHRRELQTYLREDGFFSLVRDVGIPSNNLTWFDTSAEQLFAQISVLADQHLANIIRSGEDDRESHSLEESSSIAESKTFLASLIGHEVPKVREAGNSRGVATEASMRAAAQIVLPQPAEYLRPQIDTALDRLQIFIVGKWRRMLRLASCVTAALLALVVIAYSPVGFGVALATVFGAFAVGGFFAWFARDVTAAIERWRR